MGAVPAQLASLSFRAGCPRSRLHSATASLQPAQACHPPAHASHMHLTRGLQPRHPSPSLSSSARSSPHLWRCVRQPLPARTQARTHLGELGGAQGPTCSASDQITGAGDIPLCSESRLYSEGERSRGGSVRAYAEDLPTQAEAIVGGVATADAPAPKMLPDLDYLQELIAIQQQGPRSIGFFGTRNMGFLHQQLIEILSYAMIITNNHIFTSGAAGTNAAVIRGALRAERPDLLTVILPQSLVKQPPESQELLQKVQNLVEMPHNDHLPLIEASRLCNMDILSHVQQVICFAFHDSRLLMETCQEAKQLRKIVTLFYLD